MMGCFYFYVYIVFFDVKFIVNGIVVYIVFYGSWNCNFVDGYCVMRVDFWNGDLVVDVSLMMVQILVMENSNVGGCFNNCFCLVGLVFDVKGCLYVLSDMIGEIYVIYGV